MKASFTPGHLSGSSPCRLCTWIDPCLPRLEQTKRIEREDFWNDAYMYTLKENRKSSF